MNFEFVSWLAAGTILATATAILISRDWRMSLAALAVQYLAMFLLVTRHLPFAMGAAKLITGWMVVTVLGMTRLGLTLEEEEDVFWSRGTWFRFILMGIVTLAAVGASLNIDALIPGMGLPVIVGGLILAGAGALHVSVTTDVLRVAMGLLTALAGFEILYAAVESSILVSGLLAIVNLGLGIAGAYLLTAGVVPSKAETNCERSVLWIAVPIAVGLLNLFVLRERFAAWIGGGAAAVLALIALFLPIDVPLLLGRISIKIAPAAQVFGRSFELNSADGPLLAIVYGLSAFWFFGAEASGTAPRFVSLGLMIVALLTASIAVEPFLYAALLLEMAAMLTVPLLVPLYQRAGRGVVRFLIYQTLAMPFLLFSGWMLAGVEASPGDLRATVQAGVMLGLGFAFLLAVFPLYNWIPLLMEEASPYVTAFLLWALPSFTVIFALGFLDRYAWLRTSEQFAAAMQFAGVFTAASAGVFAALQRHAGRILGYAVIAETGLLIVLMGARTPEIVNAIFLTLIPRGLALTVWSLSLAIVKRRAYSLRFSELQGLARAYPAAAAAMILAHLSMTGFPLLAGFPPRLVIWQTLAGQSLAAVFWILLGMLGLLTAALRSLAALVMAGENAKWEFNETRTQAVMLGLGVLGLFALGMFPQIPQLLTAGIPALFDHLR